MKKLITILFLVLGTIGYSQNFLGLTIKYTYDNLDKTEYTMTFNEYLKGDNANIFCIQTESKDKQRLFTMHYDNNNICFHYSIMGYLSTLNGIVEYCNNNYVIGDGCWYDYSGTIQTKYTITRYVEDSTYSLDGFIIK